MNLEFIVHLRVLLSFFNIHQYILVILTVKLFILGYTLFILRETKYTFLLNVLLWVQQYFKSDITTYDRQWMRWMKTLRNHTNMKGRRPQKIISTKTWQSSRFCHLFLTQWTLFVSLGGPLTQQRENRPLLVGQKLLLCQ